MELVSCDADLKHRPLLANLLLLVCLAATGTLIYFHPRAIFDSTAILNEAVDEESTEAATPEPVAVPTTTRQLPKAHTGTNDGDGEEAGTGGGATDQGFTESDKPKVPLKKLKISPEDKSLTDTLLYQTGIGIDPRMPISEKDQQTAYNFFGIQQRIGNINDKQYEILAAHLEARPVIYATGMRFFQELGGNDGDLPSSEKRDEILARAKTALAEGKLKPYEFDYLEVKARKNLGAHAMKEASLQPAQIPWYLISYGTEWNWMTPLSWFTAPFIHVTWRELLVTMGLFIGFATMIEGKAGSAWFTGILVGSLVVTGLLNGLMGLASPFVFADHGMGDMNQVLAGMLLVWVPFNGLQYGFLGFHVKIWVLVAIWSVLNIIATLLLLLVGFPPLLAVMGTIGYPAIGIAIGTWLLRRGVVESDGWDLYTWWRTRGLTDTERNDLQKQKEIALRQAAFQAGQGSDREEDNAAAPDSFGTTIGGLKAKPSGGGSASNAGPASGARSASTQQAASSPFIEATPSESPFLEESASSPFIEEQSSPTTINAESDDLLFSDEAAANLDPDATIVDAAPVEDGAPVDPASDTRHDHSATDTKECHSQLRRALRKGDSFRIYNCYDRLRQADPDWTPPQAMVDRLAKSLYKHEHFLEALRCADDLIAIHPRDAADAHLIAAAVRITQMQDPRRALDHLDQLDLGTLKEARRERAKLLRTDANTMLDAQGDRQLEFA